MRIAFFILNVFDYDSRAQLICEDIVSCNWQLEIITAAGGKMTSFKGAPIHQIPQPTWPLRQRRFIEFNIRAAALGRKFKPDICHAVDLDTLWAAVRSAGKNARVLYESREFYTGLLALAHRPITRNFWRLLEKRLIRRVDAVVTVNEAIAEKIESVYRIRRPAVVMNLARSAESAKPIDLRLTCGVRAKFVLVFQGILREGQGLFSCLRIIAALPETALLVIGDGPLRGKLELAAAELGITDRVFFVGMVPPQELPCWTAAADAGFLLLEPVSENHRLALPQKLFQYICAGVPPIVSDIPGLRRIVESDGLGLVLESDNPIQPDKVRDFLVQRKEDARKSCLAARPKYVWEKESPKLMSIYHELGR